MDNCCCREQVADLDDLEPSPELSRGWEDASAPAAVACAIAQFDAEFGFRNFEVIGYGCRDLTAVLRAPDGKFYEVRVTERG